MYENQDKIWRVLEIIKARLRTIKQKTKMGKIMVGINPKDFADYDLNAEQFIGILSQLYTLRIIGKFEQNEDGVYEDNDGRITHWIENPDDYHGDYSFLVKLNRFNGFYREASKQYNIRQSKRKIKIFYSAGHGFLSYDKKLNYPIGRGRQKMVEEMLDNTKPASAKKLIDLTGIKTVPSLSRSIKELNEKFEHEFGFGQDVVVNIRPRGYCLNKDVYDIIKI